MREYKNRFEQAAESHMRNTVVLCVLLFLGLGAVMYGISHWIVIGSLEINQLSIRSVIRESFDSSQEAMQDVDEKWTNYEMFTNSWELVIVRIDRMLMETSEKTHKLIRATFLLGFLLTYTITFVVARSFVANLDSMLAHYGPASLEALKGAIDEAIAWHGDRQGNQQSQTIRPENKEKRAGLKSTT